MLNQMALHMGDYKHTNTQLANHIVTVGNLQLLVAVHLKVIAHLGL